MKEFTVEKGIGQAVIHKSSMENSSLKYLSGPINLENMIFISNLQKIKYIDISISKETPLTLFNVNFDNNLYSQFVLIVVPSFKAVHVPWINSPLWNH